MARLFRKLFCTHRWYEQYPVWADATLYRCGDCGKEKVFKYPPVNPLNV